MEEQTNDVSPLDGPVPEGEGWTEMAPPLPPVGILAAMTDHSLANLAPYGRYHSFKKGMTIIREGQAQDRFYVVVQGKLAIVAMVDGKEMALNEAETGECIGEISLLAPGPASATVRAVESAVLWSMDIDGFRTYISEHVGGAGILMLGMAACLCHRMRHANAMIVSHHKKPVETLAPGRERAITAENTPVQIGFFDRLKQSIVGESKPQISDKIKM